MAATLATIVAGILVALFLSGLDPFDPTAVAESPSPEVEPEPSASVPVEPVPSASLAPPAATATPAALPGTLAFGTGLDGNQQVTGPTEQYAPADTIAYSIAVPEPFGVATLGIQVIEVLPDGSEQEVIPPAENTLQVDPEATVRGVVCCEASYLIGQLGPGEYIMRVYVGDSPLAEGRFRLSEG